MGVTKVLLRPGDVYVLSGSSRFDWTHCIPSEARSSIRDRSVEGGMMVVEREERVSITLRRMVDDWDPKWHAVPAHSPMYTTP
jgi:hypothetical protein